MPFGLSNAPVNFQGYVNKILAEKLDVFVIVYLNNIVYLDDIVYLDNIVIYTKNAGQGHVKAVR